MSGWVKILIVYSLVAAAAASRLASAASEPALFRLAEFSLSGDYMNQPLVADIFCDLQSRPEFLRIWIQLAALKYQRLHAVGKDEAEVANEIGVLRDQHRALLMNRNGTGQMDDSVERLWLESDWAMALSQNVTRQAYLRARLAHTVGRWDTAHLVLVRYQWRHGRKFLVYLKLPEAPAPRI